MADTLVGSLCRESCRLRSRTAQVLLALPRCQNPALQHRLQHEMSVLGRRMEELRQLCAQLRRSGMLGDSLGLALLEELCRRPPLLA
jgi:signal transduction histidine kinase